MKVPLKNNQPLLNSRSAKKNTVRIWVGDQYSLSPKTEDRHCNALHEHIIVGYSLNVACTRNTSETENGTSNIRHTVVGSSFIKRVLKMQPAYRCLTSLVANFEPLIFQQLIAKPSFLFAPPSTSPCQTLRSPGSSRLSHVIWHRG